MSLIEILQQQRLSSAEIESRTSDIHTDLLRTSQTIDGPNFNAIHSHDLGTLFDLYDRHFFHGRVRQTLGNSPLTFRLSRRLTSAAGQMSRRTRRIVREQPGKTWGADRFEYEISVSTTILFQSFTEPDARTKASGILCHNRLQALQRVFEHELIHLAEMLVWSESECSGGRFQSIAQRMFGHREHTHHLVTSREHAFKKYGCRVGDWVSFQFEGKRFEGRVNRVTRRATVLVEDPAGVRYTDGKHYRKFYIPLSMLERSNPETSGRGNTRN